MIAEILQPDLRLLIDARDWDGLREALEDMDPSDVADLIEKLPVDMEGIVFRLLPSARATAVFSQLELDHQEDLLRSLTSEETLHLVGGMTPDDRVRLLDELPTGVSRRLVMMLPPDKRNDTTALLGYPEDSAGRLMTPHFVALEPQWTVARALRHIRALKEEIETFNVVYVLDEQGRLVRDLRLVALLKASPRQRVGRLEDRALVSVPATMPREELVEQFKKYDRVALPVIDSHGVMLGIITADDVLDVQAEESTEDIHKMGGTQALDEPYLETSFFSILHKRGPWLLLLFLGQSVTASVMGHFEGELASALVLALFVPLIISSGGNSGSQTTSLVIRAMALKELEPGDWWKVMARELSTGLALGAMLGGLGFARIVAWQKLGWTDYGEHYLLVGATVLLSLLGVVLLGTLAGALLPFGLRRLGLDPAAASAPFVATLVDVLGLILYFSVAFFILRGTLL
jgi:magnesium transporter